MKQNQSRGLMKKILRWMGLGGISLLMVVILTILAGRGINAHLIRIDTENGIQESSFVDIGGIQQFIQIRGEDTTNPVILVLHGGPGSTMGYYSYWWQTKLESQYTMVHWDQRGSGTTYYANQVGNKKKSMDLSLEVLLTDLDDLVEYLGKRFGQKDIILLGHSWGTILGTMYAQDYPEKVKAYIGVGQSVNMLEGESLAAIEAIRMAKQKGDDALAEKISTAYEEFVKDDFTVIKMMNLRNQTYQVLPTGNTMSVGKQLWMGASSPQMGWDDIRWYLFPLFDFDGFASVNDNLYRRLIGEDGIDLFAFELQYQVPMYFISGKDDWVTPVALMQQYVDTIIAPSKRIVLIDDAGHSPFLDQPSAFMDALYQVLKELPN